MALRGELFKTAESNPAAFKLRWFELLSDGTLQWSDGEGAPPKNAVSLHDALIALEPVITPDPKAKGADAEALFGIRITLATGSRVLIVRATSDEERRLWAESMDAVAHAVPAYSTGSAGRTIRLALPASGPLGIDLGADPSSPCVAILGAGKVGAAAGLNVGDVIVAVDSTVVRTMAIAERAFARAKGSITLRLAGWNREVRLVKQSGLSGLTLCAPDTSSASGAALGQGVIVQSVGRDSAASAAGLNPGDRVLAVNGQRCGSEHEQATNIIRASLQEVRLVVAGHSVAIPLRKGADGRLGLGFAHGPAPRGAQGALITDVMPRSAAHQAGLRNGDLLIAVDGELVKDQQSGLRLLSTAARALICVVWRPSPDLDMASADAATGAGGAAGASAGTGGAAAAGGGGGAAAGGSAAVADEKVALMIGAVPHAYYSHSLIGAAAALPANVALYEDLT